jgi:hypothetical protein
MYLLYAHLTRPRFESLNGRSIWRVEDSFASRMCAVIVERKQYIRFTKGIPTEHVALIVLNTTPASNIAGDA